MKLSVTTLTHAHTLGIGRIAVAVGVFNLFSQYLMEKWLKRVKAVRFVALNELALVDFRFVFDRAFNLYAHSIVKFNVEMYLASGGFINSYGKICEMKNGLKNNRRSS